MTDIADPKMSPAVNHWFEAFAHHEIKVALPAFVVEHMERINAASRERWGDPEYQRALWRLVVSGWAAEKKDKLITNFGFPLPGDEVVEWLKGNTEVAHNWVNNPEAQVLDAPDAAKKWLNDVIYAVNQSPSAEPFREIIELYKIKVKKPRIIAEALYMKNSGEVVRVPLPKYSKLVRSLRRCVAAREVAGFDSVLVIARRRMEYYVWSYRGEWMQSTRKNNRGAEVPSKPFTKRELGQTL